MDTDGGGKEGTKEGKGKNGKKVEETDDGKAHADCRVIVLGRPNVGKSTLVTPSFIFITLEPRVAWHKGL